MLHCPNGYTDVQEYSTIQYTRCNLFPVWYKKNCKNLDCSFGVIKISTQPYCEKNCQKTPLFSKTSFCRIFHYKVIQVQNFSDNSNVVSLETKNKSIFVVNLTVYTEKCKEDSFFFHLVIKRMRVWNSRVFYSKLKNEQCIFDLGTTFTSERRYACVCDRLLLTEQ